MNARLFGYGTFRNDGWRRDILGAAYPVEPATLHGWRRTVTPAGYLSIVADPRAAALPGVLIALDAVGWAIADAWEEVPRYRRIEVEVVTAGGPVPATAYAYAGRDATAPLEDERFALLDDVLVSAAIQRFAPSMRALRDGVRRRRTR